MQKHVVSMIVANYPGVLCRVSGLFSRRGYNIDSITEGVTHDPELARMTVVVTADDRMLEQVVKQLNKLVDVKQVKQLPYDKSSLSEVALVKVKVKDDEYDDLMKTINRLDMKVMDVGQDTITVQVVSDSGRINEMINEIKRYGVLELARTGMVALERGDSTLLK